VDTNLPLNALRILVAGCSPQVDQRMNGDGVGLPLGVSDPALGWVILGVVTFVWTLYYTSSLGEFGDEGDDSGLGL
jgi:photosystem II PsbW protein